MTETVSDDGVDLWGRILFPYAHEQMEMLRSTGKRLVHYTKLEVACSIFREKSFWMRNAAVMNDYSEIYWGERCLKKALESDAGSRFRTLIEEMFPGSYDWALAYFNEWKRDFRTKTYLASLSIHEDDEDDWGRLSMWRAYGNVAIVFRSNAFLKPGSVYMPTSGPVAISPLSKRPLT